MRGELCISVASVLSCVQFINAQLSFELIFLTSRSFASMILLIFLHVRIFQKFAYRTLNNFIFLGRPDKYLHCTPQDIHGKSTC